MLKVAVVEKSVEFITHVLKEQMGKFPLPREIIRADACVRENNPGQKPVTIKAATQAYRLHFVLAEERWMEVH
ncbi:MAG TPA: hypothetical protein PLL77_14875 [Pyrinomonadaceae bacterium]|nr:hypothetical protein [Pyrinomonadaceae bacterium]